MFFRWCCSTGTQIGLVIPPTKSEWRWIRNCICLEIKITTKDQNFYQVGRVVFFFRYWVFDVFWLACGILKGCLFLILICSLWFVIDNTFVDSRHFFQFFRRRRRTTQSSRNKAKYNAALTQIKKQTRNGFITKKWEQKNDEGTGFDRKEKINCIG